MDHVLVREVPLPGIHGGPTRGFVDSMGGVHESFTKLGPPLLWRTSPMPNFVEPHLEHEAAACRSIPAQLGVRVELGYGEVGGLGLKPQGQV